MLTTQSTGHHLLNSLRIEGPDDGAAESHLSVETVKIDITQVKVSITFVEPTHPSQFRIAWSLPVVDVMGYWHPGADRAKRYVADWGRGFKSKATSSAPVGCLYNAAGQNRLAFALSDALNPVEVKVGVNEETAVFHCSITFFVEPTPALTSYSAEIRFDTRSIPYFQALHDIQSWWTTFPGYEPAPVPDIARRPMYSTWYSFHQQVHPASLIEQCKLAKPLGCEAIIIDDGWQTSDNHRGYGYCGDWEVAAGKIPNMQALIQGIHDTGMKALLWYSVPFVGYHSQAWQRFSEKLLGEIPVLDCGVLDPRYPEVREYLISTYERAVVEWDLDGLKLDFVDSFVESSTLDGEGKAAPPDGSAWDYASVPAAVDRLLSDVIARLRTIKPDIMIEFRQSYIGPLMRKYGNMFRAGDCPNDAIENRVKTLDVRLISGSTCTHSDMMMWNVDEPVESAARQLINVLFSVPQVSVRLNDIPSDHQKMVKFWLAFWLSYREVLLDGELQPLRPELLYPVVSSTLARKRVTAVYDDSVVTIDDRNLNEMVFVNGTSEDRLVLDVRADLGQYKVLVRNCVGDFVHTSTRHLSEGLQRLVIPRSGVGVLTR